MSKVVTKVLWQAIFEVTDEDGMVQSIEQAEPTLIVPFTQAECAKVYARALEKKIDLEAKLTAAKEEPRVAPPSADGASMPEDGVEAALVN